MPRKIAASAAAICLAVASLTGCSGALSTEESCTKLNEQIKERGLNEKFDSGDIALAQGETAEFQVAMQDFVEMLDDVAGKTADKHLEDSLRTQEQLGRETLEILADGSASVDTQMSRIAELNAEKQQTGDEYLGIACPDLESRF